MLVCEQSLNPENGLIPTQTVANSNMFLIVDTTVIMVLKNKAMYTLLMSRQQKIYQMWKED